MTRSALGKMARALRKEFGKPEIWATVRGRIMWQAGGIDLNAAQRLAENPRGLRAFKRRYGITASERDLAAHLPGGKSAFTP